MKVFLVLLAIAPLCLNALSLTDPYAAAKSADAACDANSQIPDAIKQTGCGNGRLLAIVERYFGKNGTNQTTSQICGAVQNLTGKAQVSLYVNLGALNQTCRKALQLGCPPGQAPNVLSKATSVISCVLNGLGTTVGGDVGNGVVKNLQLKSLIPALLVLLAVTVDKLFNALCEGNLQTVYIVLGILPIILIAVIAGLTGPLMSDKVPKLLAAVVISVFQLLYTVIGILRPVLNLLGGSTQETGKCSGLSCLLGTVFGLLQPVLKSLAPVTDLLKGIDGGTVSGLVDTLSNGKDLVSIVLKTAVGTLSPVTGRLLGSGPGLNKSCGVGVAGLLQPLLDPVLGILSQVGDTGDVAGAGSLTNTLQSVLETLLPTLVSVLGAVGPAVPALGG